MRGEIIESRWNFPRLNLPFVDRPLTARAAFIEGRYRLTPRFFAAARVDRLTFSRIAGQRFFGGVATPWDAPVRRAEVGGGIYVLRNLVGRVVVQHNKRDAGLVRSRTFVSGQVSYWF